MTLDTLKVCCVLFNRNSKVHPFSRMYNEEWVEKLYRGFKRNLTVDFRFVVFVDRWRTFQEQKIVQKKLIHPPFGYHSCVEPYCTEGPMIMVGLDTVVVGNVDFLASHLDKTDRLALPTDPYHSEKACNGVALVPKGVPEPIYRRWVQTKQNDMELICSQPHDRIDDLFPGKVVSYKGHVLKNGLGDARIVYFHGAKKPHEIDEDFVREHWV